MQAFLSDSDRDLTPGAVTAILSQGWLSLAKSYDSDYPHDPAPFRRRYDFGGKLVRNIFKAKCKERDNKIPSGSCDIHNAQYLA